MCIANTIRKPSYVTNNTKKSIASFPPCSFEVGKKKIKDKVAAEKMKLKQQYKRELKATIREVKKDRAFIAEQTIKERIKRYGLL